MFIFIVLHDLYIFLFSVFWLVLTCASVMPLVAWFAQWLANKAVTRKGLVTKDNISGSCTTKPPVFIPPQCFDTCVSDIKDFQDRSLRFGPHSTLANTIQHHTLVVNNAMIQRRILYCSVLQSETDRLIQAKTYLHGLPYPDQIITILNGKFYPKTQLSGHFKLHLAEEQRLLELAESARITHLSEILKHHQMSYVDGVIVLKKRASLMQNDYQHWWPGTLEDSRQTIRELEALYPQHPPEPTLLDYLLSGETPPIEMLVQSVRFPIVQYKGEWCPVYGRLEYLRIEAELYWTPDIDYFLYPHWWETSHYPFGICISMVFQ